MNLLLCLSLAVIGTLAVNGGKKRDEEAVGAHKVHGNVALLDEDSNTVKASCGQRDRRGKLTHGRTEWINGKKMCVDWNAGTAGNDAVTRECGTYNMKCCEEHEYLMDFDGDLLCRDIPMCMKDNGKTPGFVSFEPTRCNFGDGTVSTCGSDAFCCDEGTNDIHSFGDYGYECRYTQRTVTEPPQPVEDTAVQTDFGCNPNFQDSEGDGCADYADGFCSEEWYDDYANAAGETARVCPQCGCVADGLFFATSKGESMPFVVYGFAAIGVVAALVGVKNCLTKKLDYETVSDSTEV